MAEDLDFDITLKGLRPGLKVFSRYVLQRELGRGGMGVVWLARDVELGDREVALKFLPELVKGDEAAVADLKRETLRSLDLTHRNIVRIYDWLADSDAAAISMEYIEGETLTGRRLKQPERVFEVSDEEFLRWVGELCEALGYAHAKRQIVHRDLKPSNLMVNGEGELKVTDFGIARSLNESRTRLSRTGGILGGIGGTLPYMSPQQAVGEPPSISDDIYSLGATLYELLTGKPPFYAGEVYEQVKTRVPPSVGERREELEVESKEEIPAEWETAIADCLSKEPERRPQSVAELAKRLGVGGEVPEAKAGELRKKRQAKAKRKGKASRVVLGIAAAVAVSAGGWWFGYEQPRRSGAMEWVEKSRTALGEGDVAAAREALRSAEERHAGYGAVRELKGEVVRETERQIGQALGKADAALATRDYLAAREAYREVLALEPEHARAVSGMEGMQKIRGKVEVRTKPGGARVEVGEGEPKESPATVGELPLGTTKIRASLPGYAAVTREVELRNDSLLLEELELKRERGTLAVESTPEGMEVEIECVKSAAGESTDLEYNKAGQTPMRLPGLPTGTYRVRMKREGWPEYEEEIEVGASAAEVARHEFGEGGFRIDSDPSGLEAELRDAEGELLKKELTPFEVSGLPTGTQYELSVYREGWPTFLQTLVAPAEKLESVVATFATGGLSVGSNEPGVVVTLSPKNSGIADLEMQLDAARYQLQNPLLSLEEEKEIRTEIEENTGKIAELVGQPSIKVYREVVPFELNDVPTGEWEILARKTACPPWKGATSIQSGKTEVVSLEYIDFQLKSEKEKCMVSSHGIELGLFHDDGYQMIRALPGEYEFSAKFAGMPLYQFPVSLPSQPNSSITIPYAGISLTVKTEPAGAKITYSHWEMGTTPATITIPRRDDQKIDLRLPGYARKKFEISKDTENGEEFFHNFSNIPEEVIPGKVLKELRDGKKLRFLEHNGAGEALLSLREGSDIIEVSVTVDNAWTTENGISNTNKIEANGQTTLEKLSKRWIEDPESSYEPIGVKIDLNGTGTRTLDAGSGRVLNQWGIRRKVFESKDLEFEWKNEGRATVEPKNEESSFVGAIFYLEGEIE